MAFPPHPQEVVVIWVHWAEAECTLYVHLSHEGSLAKVHDRVHGIVDGRVAEGEVSHVDSVVNAAARGGGKGA